MPATEIKADIAGRVLTLTNLDKVLYPATGFTKAEVIDYYLNIAPTILPHLADRAITRLRFPDGTGPDAFSFYEKNAPNGCPGWVRLQRVAASDSDIDYVVADSPATLVLLANYAALELHTPQWRIPAPAPSVIRLDAPDAPASDLLVIDLDPGAGTTMATSAKAALLAAARLAADGLIAYPRTSGSKGLQLQAAIEPVGGRAATAYARRVALDLVAAQPDLFIVQNSVAARAEKVFVDVLQNQAARNTIANYSLRGRERPTVATPITWEEVAEAAQGRPLAFVAGEVLARVEEMGDLAADLLADSGAPLPLTDE